VLNDIERRDLYRLVVARSDFNEALQSARYGIAHIRDERNPLWAPLQDAALVSYARPFTSNKPFGKLPSRYEQFDSLDLRQLHQQILELRHKTIAHSDLKIRSVIVVPRGVHYGPDEIGTPGGVVVKNRKLPIGVFREIEALCLLVVRRVNEDANVLVERMLTSQDIPDHAFDLISGGPIENN